MVDTLRPYLAEASDLPSVQRLYRELDASHGLVDADLGRRDDGDRNARLRRALSGRHACLFVVRSGPRQAAVGFVMASLLSPSADVVIEALMVHADHRRRGIGTALMRAVEGWALKSGVRFVELNVFEFNPEARGFYESLGYLTVERRMRRDPKFDVQAVVSRGDASGGSSSREPG